MMIWLKPSFCATMFPRSAQTVMFPPHLGYLLLWRWALHSPRGRAPYRDLSEWAFAMSYVGRMGYTIAFLRLYSAIMIRQPRISRLRRYHQCLPCTWYVGLLLYCTPTPATRTYCYCHSYAYRFALFVRHQGLNCGRYPPPSRVGPLIQLQASCAHLEDNATTHLVNHSPEDTIPSPSHRSKWT